MRWLLFLSLVSCHKPVGAPTNNQQNSDAGGAFEECNTICLRPGDCLMAFNDDGICPPGFRCAFRFTCVPSDGGTTD